MLSPWSSAAAEVSFLVALLPTSTYARGFGRGFLPEARSAATSGSRGLRLDISKLRIDATFKWMNVVS